MNTTMLWLQPIFAAFTGWLVIRLALYSLLRPKKLKHLVIRFAGTAANDLIDKNEIVALLHDPEALKELNPVIERHLDNFLAVKLIEKLPVLSVFLGESTVQKIKEAMMEEIELLLPVVITQYTGTMLQKIDLENAIIKKLGSLPPEQLGRQVKTAMRSDLRKLQALGFAAGLVIGLVLTLLSFIIGC